VGLTSVLMDFIKLGLLVLEVWILIPKLVMLVRLVVPTSVELAITGRDQSVMGPLLMTLKHVQSVQMVG